MPLKDPKSLYLAISVAFNPFPSPPLTEGFSWDYLREIFNERSGVAKVPNSVETLPNISVA